MKKLLTVYYSWSNGNTERIAKMLQKAACSGADIACEMQIQFDSTGGSNLETPMEEIVQWIQNVKQTLGE